MADDKSPTTENKKVKIEVEGAEQLDDASKKVGVLSSNFIELKENVVENAKAFAESSQHYREYSYLMDQISSQSKLVSESLSKGTQVTHSQAAAISVLTSKLVNANELFNNFGAGINLNNIHTFTEQYNEFASVVKNILQTGKDLTPDALQDRLKAATGFVFPLDIIKAGAAAIDKFMQSNAEAADASLRLREAILQSAASTGQLDNVYKSSGDNLENLNSLISQHAQIIFKSQVATNLVHKNIVQYYGALSKIPGMMNQVIHSTDKNGESLSALTATIQLAQGTNREYSAVLEDIKTAYNNYNATLEEALSFTGRMSEASNILGVDISLVEDFLKSSSNELGKFGNNADSSTKILVNYAKGLEEVGASGSQAVSIVKEMESNITKMTMAQKSFLSAQSGGPGGIMGAFKIEKLLKEGKADEVFEMMRKQLMKQFGKIVTLDEASSSPQLAAQYQRQRQMLMKGPLASMVSSEGDANRVMDMFKQIQLGNIKKENLKDNSYQDYISKGRILSEQTQTPFGLMKSIADDAAMKASRSKLDMFQSTFAQKSGYFDPNPASNMANVQMKENMKDFKRESSLQAYSATTELKSDLDTGKVQDRSGQYLGETLSQASNYVQKAVPDVVKAPLNTLRSMVSPSASPEAEEAKLENIKSQLKSNPVKQKMPLTTEAVKEADKVKEKKETKETREFKTSKEVVETKVDVKVTGMCIDCGKKMQQSAQTISTNPTMNQK